MTWSLVGMSSGPVTRTLRPFNLLAIACARPCALIASLISASTLGDTLRLLVDLGERKEGAGLKNSRYEEDCGLEAVCREGEPLPPTRTVFIRRDRSLMVCWRLRIVLSASAIDCRMSAAVELSGQPVLGHRAQMRKVDVPRHLGSSRLTVPQELQPSFQFRQTRFHLGRCCSQVDLACLLLRVQTDRGQLLDQGWVLSRLGQLVQLIFLDVAYRVSSTLRASLDPVMRCQARGVSRVYKPGSCCGTGGNGPWRLGVQLTPCQGSLQVQHHLLFDSLHRPHGPQIL